MIKLQQLPEAWSGRMVVFVSDLHLGQVYGESFSRKVVDKITQSELTPIVEEQNNVDANNPQ